MHRCRAGATALALCLAGLGAVMATLACASAVAATKTGARAGLDQEPKPFLDDLMDAGDHLECKTQATGVRHCAGELSDEHDWRVRSFDGQPIDADVTLPPTTGEHGVGPWPLVVMIQPWFGTKYSLQSTNAEAKSGYNNVNLALRGYAVLNYSARGWGTSCGRFYTGTSGCSGDTWTRVADARYEARDVQHMAGLLVDEGIAQPGIGVTGMSYGGAQTLILAQLRDKVMDPAGALEPWRSPEGQAMEVAAAWASITWDDMAGAFVPNGRQASDDVGDGAGLRSPPGVMKKTAIGRVFFPDPSDPEGDFWWTWVFWGSYPPEGCAGANEPATCLDFQGWMKRLWEGETYRDDAGLETLTADAQTYHSAAGVRGIAGWAPAPTFLTGGWTDDLFPATEQLRFYRSSRQAGGEVALALADIGHPRSQNKEEDIAAVYGDGLDWLDHYLKGDADALEPGAVKAWTQTCPKDSASGGPYVASTWETLAPGTVTYRSAPAQTLDHAGGDPDVAERFAPLAGGACETTTSTTQLTNRVATYALPAATSPYTLLGVPSIEAEIETHHAAGTDAEPEGQIAARLWDVDSQTGEHTLVTRGIYRLGGNERGVIEFELFGNGWRFEAGHAPKLELLGQDDPTFRASDNDEFDVEVKLLELTLPVAEQLTLELGDPADANAGVEEEPPAAVPGTGGSSAAASTNTATATGAGGETAIELTPTSPALAGDRTTRLRRTRLAAYLKRGIRARAAPDAAIKQVSAALVRKRAGHCYRLDRPRTRVSCAHTSTRGLASRASGDAVSLNYKPLARGKRLRHSAAARRLLARMRRGRVLRRGSYLLTFHLDLADGQDKRFSYHIDVR